FFFSSRRRHTRLQGDWSSDVCSSDLPAEAVELQLMVGDGETVLRGDPVLKFLDTLVLELEDVAARGADQVIVVMPIERRFISRRSEERRVGKECRCGWSAEEERKR